MNERIKELAEQAALLGPTSRVGNAHEAAERFAELVQKDEREACAELAENGLIGHTIAKAIRARGDKHD